MRLDNLTKREYFAATALGGLVVAGRKIDTRILAVMPAEERQRIAKAEIAAQVRTAVAFADALIAELRNIGETLG